MIKKYFLILGYFLITENLLAQDSQDTAAVMNEFTRVMSFTSQPYVHYVTNTTFNATPVLQVQDTATVKGEFFKNNTEIYSKNGRDEMYLQDSLMVEVNNERKTIWLRKIDLASKERMNIMPVNSKELLKTLRNNYTVRKTTVSDEFCKIEFQARKSEHSTASTSTIVYMEYSTKTWLPRSINIIVNLKEPFDEDIMIGLKQEGIEESKVVQIINGTKYLVRNQVMSVFFTLIDNQDENLKKMPRYNTIIGYDDITQEYSGKSEYKDYEITKMF